MEILFYGLVLFIVLFLLKNEITHSIRCRAIIKNYAAYRNGPSYDRMLFNPFKWTYKQFYGDAK